MEPIILNIREVRIDTISIGKGDPTFTRSKHFNDRKERVWQHLCRDSVSLDNATSE